MSDILNRGTHVDDLERYRSHGFNKKGIHKLQADTPTGDAVLEGALKIKNTLRSRGEIATDSAVEDACPVEQSVVTAKQSDTQYYLYAGPVASTHPEIRWRSAWRLDDDAPVFKSDEWNRKASELEIPESEEFLPQILRDSYKRLQDVRDRDDRPAHEEELKHYANVLVPDRTYKRAWPYLKELPGVIPPATDGPAWRYGGGE